MIPITAVEGVTLVAKAIHFHPVLQRIISVVRYYFDLLQNGFMSLFGCYETVSGSISVHQANEHSQYTGIKDKSAPKYSEKIGIIGALNTLIHGVCYIASGFFGVLVALHDINWIQLGSALPVAKILGGVFFLLANIFSLRQYVRQYQKAHKMEKMGDAEHVKRAQRAKISAILGMLNSIGYIVATLMTLFAAPLAFILTFATIALAAGCLKFIYDFFFLPNMVPSSKKA